MSDLVQGLLAMWPWIGSVGIAVWWGFLLEVPTPEDADPGPYVFVYGVTLLATAGWLLTLTVVFLL